MSCADQAAGVVGGAVDGIDYPQGSGEAVGGPAWCGGFLRQHAMVGERHGQGVGDQLVGGQVGSGDWLDVILVLDRGAAAGRCPATSVPAQWACATLSSADATSTKVSFCRATVPCRYRRWWPAGSGQPRRATVFALSLDCRYRSHVDPIAAADSFRSRSTAADDRRWRRE